MVSSVTIRLDGAIVVLLSVIDVSAEWTDPLLAVLDPSYKWIDIGSALFTSHYGVILK